MTALDPAAYEERFGRWIDLVTGMHRDFRFCKNDGVAWTPLKKPVAQSTLALVSTGGVHLKDQPPFDLDAHEGDWSYREIPWDADAGDIRLSHTHYDTSAGDEDIDCVFPIRTARSLLDAGAVGGLAPRHFGLMGFVPDGRPMRDETGPKLARLLKDEGADIVFLSPG